MVNETEYFVKSSFCPDTWDNKCNADCPHLRPGSVTENYDLSRALDSEFEGDSNYYSYRFPYCAKSSDGGRHGSK
jgi:hypothetical protein